MEVKKYVIETIVKVLSHIKKQDIKEESKFVSDLGVDAFDMVEIAIILQELFRVDIPDEALEKMVVVKDLIQYIEKQLGEYKEEVINDEESAKESTEE